MAEEDKLKEETYDLLSKVEDLKAKIKQYESELGITSPELESFISKKEAFVRNEEKTIKSEPPARTPQAVPKVETQQKQVNTETLLPSQDNMELIGSATNDTKLSASKLQDQIKRVEEQSSEISEITALLSRLRSSPNITDKTTVAPQKSEPVKETTMVQARPQSHYGEQDLPSLESLVSKIDQLVKANRQISDDLREVVKQASEASASSKLSELIRKLAVVGFNE